MSYHAKAEKEAGLILDAPEAELPGGNGNGFSAAKEATAAGPFFDSLLHVWHQRHFVAKATAVGLLLATAVAFLLPKKYESTTRLMPADKQSIPGLALLASAVDERLGQLGADALGVKTPGALLIGILRSRTVADRLIAENDLLRVYHTKLMMNARLDLWDNTDISEDRKSGIVTLSVTDKSPQPAAKLAQDYVQELNRLMRELNTSSAHKERMFIEGRLQSVKQDLSEASKALSEFSSKNTAINLPEQGKAMLAAAALLQGQLIAAQAQLSGLEQIYTDNNVRVRSLRAHIAELQKQLAKMRGGDDLTSNGNSSSGNIGGYPSIRKLPLLGVIYYDLHRQAKVEEVVYETLTKQYELAKIEEAKELPVVRVLDEPNVPERKSAPKRLQLMFLGSLLTMFFAVLYVFAGYRWTNLEFQHPVKRMGMEVRLGMAHDWEVMRQTLRWSGLRNRIPSGKTNANGASVRRDAFRSTPE